MLSLEALSHAASTVFEEGQLKGTAKLQLRRASSLGNTDLIKDLQNQRNHSSVLPAVPTLSRQTSHPCYNPPQQK